MVTVSSYLKYSTTATKPCTQSASSAPAVRLHGLSLHICGTSTRCCSHAVTSNPEEMFSLLLYYVCCTGFLMYSCKCVLCVCAVINSARYTVLLQIQSRWHNHCHIYTKHMNAYLQYYSWMKNNKVPCTTLQVIRYPYVEPKPNSTQMSKPPPPPCLQ